MRRILPGFVAVIALVVAMPLLALTTNVIDDVLRMTRAGVDEETILAYVNGEQRPFEVTADDMIAMTTAHVSQKVVQAVVDRSAALKRASANETPSLAQPAVQQGESAPPVAVVVPPPPVPDYLADPFWYMPRLDTKSGESAVKPQARPAGGSGAPAAPPRAAAPNGAAPHSTGKSSRGGGALLEVLRSLARPR